uniref:Uncharacterized protein n=1 Tax=Anopheles atroparvus TaxID=41427 RepID=A0A182J8C7_ANOAO
MCLTINQDTPVHRASSLAWGHNVSPTTSPTVERDGVRDISFGPGPSNATAQLTPVQEGNAGSVTVRDAIPVSSGPQQQNTVRSKSSSTFTTSDATANASTGGETSLARIKERRRKMRQELAMLDLEMAAVRKAEEEEKDSSVEMRKAEEWLRATDRFAAPEERFNAKRINTRKCSSRARETRRLGGSFERLPSGALRIGTGYKRRPSTGYKRFNRRRRPQRYATNQQTTN